MKKKKNEVDKRIERRRREKKEMRGIEMIKKWNNEMCQ